MSHFTQREVLDFRVIDTEENSEIYLKIVEKTSQFISSLRGLNGGKNEYVENLFNQMDLLVFSLYGITDKEILDYIISYTQENGFRVV
jgi:flagellar biosynthesis chaperone FliJ